MQLYESEGDVYFTFAPSPSARAIFHRDTRPHTPDVIRSNGSPNEFINSPGAPCIRDNVLPRRAALNPEGTGRGRRKSWVDRRCRGNFGGTWKWWREKEKRSPGKLGGWTSNICEGSRKFVGKWKLRCARCQIINVNASTKELEIHAFAFSTSLNEPRSVIHECRTSGNSLKSLNVPEPKILISSCCKTLRSCSLARFRRDPAWTINYSQPVDLYNRRVKRE